MFIARALWRAIPYMGPMGLILAPRFGSYWGRRLGLAILARRRRNG